MKITFWGSRGSIPTSGDDFKKYGGDTTCVEIRAKSGDIIIIDAGTGIRPLGNKLINSRNKNLHLFFTHFHWDHIFGFPFFKPFYNKKFKIDLYGYDSKYATFKENIDKLMSKPNFPIDKKEFKSKLNFISNYPTKTKIGSITIEKINLNHPDGGFGFKFTEDNKTFVFLGDNELDFMHEGGLTIQDYINFSKNADILVHDSAFTEKEYNHTRSWGHSMYVEALNLAIKANAKKFGLFHHNYNRTDRDIENIIKNCKSITKEYGSNLKIFATRPNTTINI